MRLGRAAMWMGAAMAVGGLALGAGCGDDDPVVVGDTLDVPLFDGADGFPDVDTFVPDTIVDTRDAVDTSPADTIPPDLVPDLDPPTIVSTSPAAGETGVALPLVVTIVFSEPLHGPTIAPASIKLVDWLGQDVPGTPTLGADGKTVTWRPTQANQQLVSAYTIRVVGNIVSDKVGNKLVNTEEFTFTTANYPNQDAYRDLAAKYAPNIHSAVDANENPQHQVPVKFDGDGDWNLVNNRTWLVTAATTLVPAVYYTVTETYTHWYIHYVYYFPYVNHPASEYASGNANVGVLVVVEKARGATAERPVLAYTFWKEGTGEEQFAFATNESGIVSNGGADDWGLKGVFAQETLFPGGRFESYVTAKTHRSCNWNWDQGGFLPACGLPAPIKNGDTLVFKYMGGSPTEVKKVNNAWPTDMSEVEGQPEAFGYALIPLYSTLWPRRFENGPDQLFESTTFSYESDSDRPGNGTKLSGAFLQSLAGADLSAFGKPVWAFGWNPSVCGPNDLCTRIRKGQIALDPAWYVWERHQRSSNPNSLVNYDDATGAGHAMTYCFNGFIALDQRGLDPKCVNP